LNEINLKDCKEMFILAELPTGFLNFTGIINCPHKATAINPPKLCCLNEAATRRLPLLLLSNYTTTMRLPLLS
jgi:hypothetical protein